MEEYKIVEIKEDITSRNNLFAAEIKRLLGQKHVYMLNVMASPGSGKTTLLVELVRKLAERYKVGVIEADIDSDVDADTISRLTGAKTLQMHTAGACHITCQMSYEALVALGYEDLDVVILENIGNLVCPAEFDTGATDNLVLLSVPEGDDKPLKYPLMFEVASVVAITKWDVRPAFDFDLAKALAGIALRNDKAPVYCLSAVTGEGVDDLAKEIETRIEDCKHE